MLCVAASAMRSGSVSIMRPRRRRRSAETASGEIAVLIVSPFACGSPHRSARSVSARSADGARRRCRRAVTSIDRALLEHARDAFDVDAVERERGLTNGLDGAISIFFSRARSARTQSASASMEVDHRANAGVLADVRAAALALSSSAHRRCEARGSISCRVVVRIRRASAGSSRGCIFDQVRREINPHRLRVDTHAHTLAEIHRRHRVERARDLDVMIGMHLSLRQTKARPKGAVGAASIAIFSTSSYRRVAPCASCRGRARRRCRGNTTPRPSPICERLCMRSRPHTNRRART